MEAVGDDAPAVYNPAAPPSWKLRNRGSRTLWIHRAELKDVATLEAFFPATFTCPPVKIPPLSFGDLNWVALKPSGTLPLESPALPDWGRVKWRILIGNANERLLRQAEAANGAEPSPKHPTFAVSKGASLHLPPFDWAGPPEKVGFRVLKLRPETDGTLSGEERAWTAWVLSDDRRLLYEGPLELASREPLRYKIPAALPRGPRKIFAFSPSTGEFPGTPRALSLWQSLPE